MSTEELSVIKVQVLLFHLWNPAQPLDSLILDDLHVQILDLYAENEQYVASDHKYDQYDDQQCVEPDIRRSLRLVNEKEQIESDNRQHSLVNDPESVYDVVFVGFDSEEHKNHLKRQ